MSTPSAKTAKATRPPKRPHTLQGGSSQANRLAAIILEVLAGGRSPAEAAKMLGVKPPRYYQLETRALEGLVAALEPRPKTRQASPESRIAQLDKALAEARRECLRQQALVRAAQRGLGIKPPATEVHPAGKDAAGRKRRRPTVRALKAARTLSAADTRPAEPESLQQQDHEHVSPAAIAPEGDGAPRGGMACALEGSPS